MAIFAIPNPKKTITVSFEINKISQSIKAIPLLDKGYKFTKGNEAFKTYTLEALEFLSLGIYADFSLNEVSEGKTEITLELRRKMGSFDQAHEVSKANGHIDKLFDLLSKAIEMSDAEIKTLEEKVTTSSQKSSNRPWYMSTGSLVILLLFLFPVGLYGLYKRSTYKEVE